MIYQVTGYTESAQTGIIGNPISYNTLQNRLFYLSVLSSVNYAIVDKQNFKLLAVLGFEQNYCLGKKIESDDIWPVYEFYPVNRYLDKWSKYNLNYQLGFGLTFQDTVTINPFFSRS